MATDGGTMKIGKNKGSVIAVGGDNHGTISIGIPAIEPGPVPQEYRVAKASPWVVTDRTLQILSIATGLPGLIAFGWGAIRTLTSLRAWGSNPVGSGTLSSWSMAAGTVLMALAIVAVSGVMFLRKRVYALTHHPSNHAWAGVTNANGHSQLTRVTLAAECRDCGARMRFYAKPDSWRDVVDLDTNRVINRTVTKREPVIECRDNPGRHLAAFEITDARKLSGSDSA